VKQIYIYGASGHGKVVADIAKAVGYTVVAFVDDDDSKDEFCALPCIRADKMQKLPVALGIGSNKARYAVFEKLKKGSFETPALIHPSAIISPSAIIEDATVVMPHSVINADANIGTACIINTAAVIEHDCTIGDFTHISPNAALAGGVTVGEMSHIGIGTNVIQLIKIGANCTIGAGAAVISDIKDDSVAVGVPAKIIKENR
jgi:UDP-N-acetylbacillosamine N-acetyltransferase